MLVHSGEIFACILLNRLITFLERNLPGCSTVDMLFVVRQVLEKCTQQNKDLYAIFIDLTKAYSTVNREALRAVQAEYSCPSKMKWLLQYDMTGQVLCSSDLLVAFTITNSMKLGCVLAPVLFSLFCTWMLSHTVQNMHEGAYIWMACYLISDT